MHSCEDLDEDAVWGLQEAADLSEFYFEAAVHPKLTDAVKKALNLLVLNGEWRDAIQEGSIQAESFRVRSRELKRGLIDECSQYAKEMRRQLHVSEA